MGQSGSQIVTVKPSDRKHSTGNKSLPVVPPLDLKLFANNALKAHREFRKAHRAPRIFLDHDLTTIAQNWADHLAKIDALDHQKTVPYGENLYFCQGFTPTGFRTVQRWYEEIKDYDFDQPHYSSETGHFTQVVWCQTRKFGIGVGRSSKGNYYVVAYYDPPGNVKSYFSENVLRRLDEPLECSDNTTGDRIKLTFHKFNKFQKNCLAVHNTYRVHHGVHPLVLAVQICKDAQAWAENLAAENKIQFQGASMYGENVFSVNQPEVTARMAVDAWYNERAKYDGKYSVDTGHFTQVIWAQSLELGVGVARSSTGQVFVVAYYFPPGNIQDEYEKNVLNWAKL